MTKSLFNLLIICMVSFLAVSCSKDDEAPANVYEEVNYATINGCWQLTEFNGSPLQEGQYVYITFNRKEHTFEMYDNMNSMYSHKSTGSFTIEEDYDYGTIITGEYDFSDEIWDEYIVSEMTATTMKWTKKENKNDVSVYTRCAEVPEEVVIGSKSVSAF